MIDGIIIVNKPLGYTSRDAVNVVGKALNTHKIGHTGTLDPKASGVMILCVGKALKMCELLESDYKEYVAEIILGIETDTLDMDHNATILKDIKVNVSDGEIIKCVNSFRGKYMQEVPIYSSVKVNGRKLYEYARNNISVKLPEKEVNIKNINIEGDILRKDGKIYFKIKCTVGKGTYVRALIRDIGIRLGVPAVMNSLVRTKVGRFTLNDSYTLDDIKSGNYKLISILDAFSDIPVVKVNDDIAFKVKNGVILDKLSDYDMTFITDSHDNLLALYKKIDDKFRPYKMFI